MRCCITKPNLLHTFTTIEFNPRRYCHIRPRFDIGQAVLQHKGDSKVGVVIHADHYSNNMMSEQHILWNNYYEYQFSKAKYIDFFITATDIQKIIWFVDNLSNIKVIAHVFILFLWEALMHYHYQ